MSALEDRLSDYLTLRRSLGFKLERPGQLLAQFVAWMEEADESTITVDLAVAWAMQPVGADPIWWGARLHAVRIFAGYLQSIDPGTEIPPADLLPARSRRAEPFDYTDADIAGLLAAARSIHSPLRAATYETLIGLLAATGMRVGEALRLDRCDIDLTVGLLQVLGSKFGKSREVPLHPSVTTALANYTRVRARWCPRPVDPSFFVSTTGTRVIYQNVHTTFRHLVRMAGIEARSRRCRPRIHDLRHRFAVSTLLAWHSNGIEIGPMLPVLSTYLGHACPSSTYWYLHATPELFGLVAERLESAMEGQS
ncbi:MAG TPA: tyrosine-type recombinase/integrase [Acidimicrobiales bacterium]|jgi:integrase|nr:tyrosine-type recombinase/integrase [Acidimicrobiales bacterium]